MKNIFTREFWSERDIELYIGNVLRYGVIISCIITLLGGVFYIYQHLGVIPNYKQLPQGVEFKGVAEYLRELTTILPEVFKLNGAAIIQLGVVVLIATPIVRVAFSAFSFLLERDYMYVVITIIVLLIIVSNMILGFH